MSVVILGGGLNAQIAKFYIPNSIVISQNGYSTPQYICWYLHKDEYSEKLLKDLKVLTSIRRINVGYFIKGHVLTNCPPEYRRMYSLKTRGVANVPDSMNKGKGSFYAFNITADNLSEILQQKIGTDGLIKEKIVRINLDSNTIVTEKQKINYDILISTIPRPEFGRLARIPMVCRFHSVGVTIEHELFDTPLFREYDIVYFPEYSITFYRASQIKEGTWAVEYIQTYNSRINYDFIIKYGKIIPPYSREKEIKRFNAKKVFFVGRFSIWKGGYKINDTIRDVLNLRSVIK